MQPSLFPTKIDAAGDAQKPSPAASRHATSRGERGFTVSRADLNPAQYEAATHHHGPLLVIAGAGSGKTRTLVYRVASLIGAGIPPESILLLTFTRKAAQEMLWRAGALTDGSCQRVTGGTFHAVANILLRQFGHHIGFAPNFTILDRSDAEDIVNILKSSLSLAGSGKRFPSKRVVLNALSKAVNKSVDLATLLADEFNHLEEFFDDILLLRKHYEQFKFDHGLMDYDDLLVHLRRLLRDFEPVRQAVSARFSHIMVDEYQDTNPIQAEIVRLIAAPANNVMVVGDDAQSIYSFRGADFRNIMEFPRFFPGTRIIKLEENYRSTQPILKLTNKLIEGAAEKYTKELFSRTDEGKRPVLHAARDAGGEARFIVDEIAKLHREGVPYHDMAVLFRSSFHSYKLEMELANQGIPFEKRGGLKLTESAHVKDALCFLRVVANPDDNLSWNRLLLLVDKVGPKTAGRILELMKTDETAFDTASDELTAGGKPGSELARLVTGKTWTSAMTGLFSLIRELRDPALSPGEQLERVLHFYRPTFERVYFDDFPKRARDLEHLEGIAAGYADLASLIADTALDPPEADAATSLPGDTLVLSTIHSAKGLEWHAVFVISLAEGKFPFGNTLPGPGMEEERRLLYVAATRAKRKLFLTFPRENPQDRMLQIADMSPFLAELPASLYEKSGATSFERPVSTMGFAATPSSRASGVSSRYAAPSAVKAAKLDASQLPPGTEVRHNFFGQGTVKRILGDRSVEVFFTAHGPKTLHLDYAKLELVK